jgi:hypothetical protein
LQGEVETRTLEEGFSPPVFRAWLPAHSICTIHLPVASAV